jgi:hypothetical protein
LNEKEKLLLGKYIRGKIPKVIFLLKALIESSGMRKQLGGQKKIPRLALLLFWCYP